MMDTIGATAISGSVLGATGEGMVPSYQTWIFAAILASTLLMFALEKIHKTVLAMLSAGLCLFLADFWGYFPHVEGHQLPVYIEMIEWEVIGIVIGATVFVEVAARSGIFTWVSITILKASKGDPFKLLVFLSVLTVVFSAFLDNITAMIIVGSLTVVACRKLSLDLKPFLITEAIMTNVGGLLTLISSIPNIIVGKVAGISYLSFLIVTLPYVVLAVMMSLFISRRLFSETVKPIKDAETAKHNQALVEAFDEWEGVDDMRFFYTSIVGVALVILAFAFKDQIPILQDFGIEIVAMGAAVIMLLLHAKDVEHDLEKVEWSLVFFFVGLFTIIGVVERAGVLEEIGTVITKVTALVGAGGLMWLTAVFSSITDNIPLAAMLARILGPTPAAAGALPATQWWAVVFGANLGGNITPIGSASTVVACTLMKQSKLHVTFIAFVKVGLVFAVAQLVLASVYLWILERVL